MVKKFCPTTPSRRKLILESMHELTRIAGSRSLVKPEKLLCRPKTRINGRNNHGRITCRHRGGGQKRQYRIIDFKRNKDNIEGTVDSIQYDPNRSAHIALIYYIDGEKRYIIAPQGLRKGDSIISSSEKVPYKVGCCSPLKTMPLGSTIHNIEMHPGKGGKLVRAAGLSAQLLAKGNGYVTIKMPSKETRLLHENCRATFGAISNVEHNLRVEGKAGRMRWKGIRPTVRGTAMNPVDHPHGGGEGKHNGYLPQTPWGKYTKGYKTRSKKKTKKWIVKDRRKK